MTGSNISATIELENGAELTIDDLKRIHYNNYASDLPDDIDDYARLAGEAIDGGGPAYPDISVVHDVLGEHTTSCTGAFYHPKKRYLVIR